MQSFSTLNDCVLNKLGNTTTVPRAVFTATSITHGTSFESNSSDNESDYDSESDLGSEA